MTPRPPLRLAAVALLGWACAASAAEMSPHFKPFQPFLGKTFKAVFPKSTAERPIVDVSRWELVLNGQAIRNLHSVNDGAYGGETLIVWDKEKEKLVYFYFTTDGFHTTGSFAFEDGAIVSHEVVTGNADGVTEVKAVSRVLPDGRLQVRTQFLKGGAWTDGGERVYAEDPKAEVRFK